MSNVLAAHCFLNSVFLYHISHANSKAYNILQDN